MSPIRKPRVEPLRHHWLFYEGAAGQMIDADMRDETGDSVWSKAMDPKPLEENWMQWLMVGRDDGEPRVRVVISPETSWPTAVALLRKIADWIETDGLEEFEDSDQ